MRPNILACTIVAMSLYSGVTASAQDPPAGDDRKPAEQQTTDAKKPPTPEHTGIHALFRDLGADYKNLAHLDNVYVAAIGGGLALAAHPVDQSFNAHLISHYDLVNTIYAP